MGCLRVPVAANPARRMMLLASMPHTGRGIAVPLDTPSSGHQSLSLKHGQLAGRDKGSMSR